jgi:acetyl-CoA carboxylase biotin carboxyl carrier protein
MVGLFPQVTDMSPNLPKEVAALFRLFRERGLIELLVEDGSCKLHLRREALAARPAIAAARAQRQAPRARPRPSRGRTVAVRSPLIGVFYRAPTSESPPFVEIGDMVSEGETVCIVEAMKVFNEIKAEWAGRVVAIPAQTGALVQAGDPLIVLEFADTQEQEGD